MVRDAIRRSDSDYVNINAENLFTDRQPYRDAFWEMFIACSNGKCGVIDFYGDGGIGKTSLLKQLGKEMEEKKYSKKDYIYLDLEDKPTKEDFLFKLSRSLMARIRGLSCPVFDTAFEKMLREEGKSISQYENRMKEKMSGEGIIEIIRDVATNSMDAAIKDTVGEVVKGTLETASEFIPYGSVAMKLVEGAFRFAGSKKSDHEKKNGKNKNAYSEIQRNSNKELRRDLQNYLATDIDEFLAKRDKPFVIFLDGYENFVDVRRTGLIDANSEEDWWLKDPKKGLVRMPNTVWVIAGRNQLHWSEDVLSPEDMHRIGDLSEVDTALYLKKAGINDERLISGLFSLTNGTPIYLDLCVKTYHNRTGEGVPSIEEFGKNREEIARRCLEDMPEDMRNMLIILSGLPNVWTRKQAEEAARCVNYGAFLPALDKVLNLSLIEPVSDGYRLHRTMRDAIHEMDVYGIRTEFSEAKEIIQKVEENAFESIKNKLLSADESDYRMDLLREVTEQLASDNFTGSVSDEELKNITDIIDSETRMSGDYRTCAALIDRVICYEEKHDASAETLVKSKYVRNYNLYKLGEYKKLLETAENDYLFAKNNLGEEDRKTLSCLDNLAIGYGMTGDNDKALELEKKCYEAYVRVLGEEHPETLGILNNLANGYASTGDHAKALELYQKCYEARVRVRGEADPITLSILNNLANSYEDTGDHAKAFELRKKCYETSVRVLGEEHPDTLRSAKALKRSQTIQVILNNMTKTNSNNNSLNITEPTGTANQQTVNSKKSTELFDTLCARRVENERFNEEIKNRIEKYHSAVLPWKKKELMAEISGMLQKSLTDILDMEEGFKNCDYAGEVRENVERALTRQKRFVESYMENIEKGKI